MGKSKRRIKLKTYYRKTGMKKTTRFKDREKLYSLQNTPILLEFLKRLFEIENIVCNFNIEKELFLHSQCKCGQKDCATVTLKRKGKRFRPESIGIYHNNANDSMILIRIAKKGFIEVEALCSEKFPYKLEVNNFFKNKSESKKKSISDLEKKAVHDFFKDYRQDHKDSIKI